MEIKCKYGKLIDIKSLKYHPKNPNKHSKEQIERLSKNISVLGMRHPIIISKLSGYIVAGNGRFEALIKLKVKEAPVDYQDFTDEAEEYAFMLSDNTLQMEFAEIDRALVNNEIGNFGPDFDMELLGFKDFTIDVADKVIESESGEEELTTCPQCGHRF